MEKQKSLAKLLPVLFGFFIMGFVDVVGISTSYVKQDFNLSDTLSNLLPMMVFVWFFIFSVPTGLMMNKIGRKKTVLISMVVTIIAMFTPFIAYNFYVVLIAFAFLGIGNTIIQVSLNPLLSNVVSGERLTSSLTLGQFIKAIASFLGPILAGVAFSRFGDWKLLFPLFGGITVLSGLWLMMTPIEEGKTGVKTSSFGQCFGLLKDVEILIYFLGILFVVGLDVGLNTVTPKLLMEKAGLPLDEAGYGTSWYFAARTLGTFIGAILLVKLSAKKFFIVTTVLGIVAMAALFFLTGHYTILAMIFTLGFALANVFSIIFGAALKHKPEFGNEISGLMIMGVAGGAIFPMIMGFVTDMIGSQIGAIIVLMVAMFYLMFTALKIKESK